MVPTISYLPCCIMFTIIMARTCSTRNTNVNRENWIQENYLPTNGAAKAVSSQQLLRRLKPQHCLPSNGRATQQTLGKSISFTPSPLPSLLLYVIFLLWWTPAVIMLKEYLVSILYSWLHKSHDKLR